jgi:acetate kinase
MKILVMNAGSSSQKSCLYEIADGILPTDVPKALWSAHVDWSHQQGMAEINIKTLINSTEKSTKISINSNSRGEVITYVLNSLTSGETKVINQLSEIDIVGHRVVHGGEFYQESTIINEEVKAAISQLCFLAPSHNPANLEGIEIIERIFGEIPQVAVFDTAFHSHIPDAAAIYPGLYKWVDQGIRRYGFHGISHQYVSQRAADILGRDLQDLKLISCHLGNGCSLAAIHSCHSIDTTMGFTPLDGLMMGTRCGTIDPGILIHLQRQYNYSVDQIDEILNKQSGLKGISGESNDLRQVMEAITKGSDRARLAFDIYIHKLRSGIGSMLASLQGLDALVFTAGVGENSPQVRTKACEAFAFLGLKIDETKNQPQNQSLPIDIDIATHDSTVRVLVIRTQEDWAIACECWKIYQDPSKIC